MKSTIISILVSPLVLMAQQNGAWTNIGPSPAAVEAIAVDPQGTGTIFMGSMAGGVRKSTDGGNTWSAVNTGLTTAIVQALAMDASGPQTVYAGTVGGGLFKTGDGGVTWKNIPALSGSIASVAADPHQSGVVYAGVFSNLANGSIRKSIDGGVTWTTIFPTTAAIYSITIDPGNSDVLYAPTVGHGAFKSTDGGLHWTAMTALTPQAIWTMALDPGNSQVVYAGTNQDGIWKSTDAGSSWQQAGAPGPLPVYSLAVDTAAHIVYAGTNGGGVWMSPDGGATWTSTGKSAGLANGMILSLAVDSSGALYAGTNSAGAQVSHDHGASWTLLNTGVDRVNKFGYGIWIDPRDNQKILVGDEDMYGLIWSQDAGATWSAAGSGFTGRGSRGVAFDPTDSRRIYAGALSGTGFLKSTDGGLTWSPRHFGSSAVYVIAVAVDPSSPNVVYVGTQNEGFFKSTDYGDTWASIGTGLSGAITYLTVDPTEGGRLFASTATAFYLSEDGGQRWTNVLNMPAWTVTIDPGDPSRVFATTRTQGVLRSSDGGHTWQSVNSGLTSLTMGRSAPVIIDSTNRQTLYVGSEGGGVFKSLDEGDHWFAVNSGLGELTVDGLAMDPRNPTVLYACGPNGVYKTLTGAEAQTASIAISAILNGASNLQAPVSPGEIVVITGSGLGPAELIPATAGANGVDSTQLSGTTVRFNAIPAPLIYTSATQVAVQVPDLVSFEGAPFEGAQVTVTYEGNTSAPFRTQVAQYAPGVFTLDSTGKGQALALNQDGSINTPSTPAKVGDVVSFFLTGLRQSDLPFTLEIGSEFPVLTSIDNFAPGILRIHAKIPSGSGSAVPVLVVLGDPNSDTDNLYTQGVSIAVQSASPAVAATNTAIGWATAVTTDPSGNVYFLSSNSVFKVDPKGVLTRIAGNLKPGYSGDGGPAIDAQLYTDDLVNETPAFGIPSGLAMDSKGNLYISDGGNARVRKVSSDGIITTVAGNGTHGYSGDGGAATAAQISSPRSLVVDGAGNLYIADSAAVRMVSATGMISTVAPFGGPGIALDGGGNLYVVDYKQGKNIVDSSGEGWDNRSSPEKEPEPVTLCIAAACRAYNGTDPAIVLCCDESGDRGLVSADASDKIRWTGDSVSVMLAGSSNKAQNLYMATYDCLVAFDKIPDPDEKNVASLKRDLEQCAANLKKDIVSNHIENSLAMSLEDFHANGRTRFGEAHFQELLTEIRMINLEAHMLVCGFSQDNGVIICVTPSGHALEQDHYCAIGTGGPIADAFYVQRPYGDTMPLRECVYRVFEAKVASEKNAYVGETTVLEVVVPGRARKGLTQAQFDWLYKTVTKRLEAIPKLSGLSGPLEALEDDDDEPQKESAQV